MPEDQHPMTICGLVNKGLAGYSGLTSSVKRDGKWIDTTAEDFVTGLYAFAAGLYDLGVRKGDRVALHAENSTEWLIIDQALLRIGAVTVPIYTTQPVDQIRHIVNDAKVRGYIVSTSDLFSSCPPDLGSVPSMDWMLGIFGRHADGMLTYEEVLVRGHKCLANDPGLVSRCESEIRGEDLATLSYTSGTTGVPKGVMLTHANIATNVVALMERLPFEPPCTMLSYLPLSHSLERLATILYLYMSCPIYFVENFLEIADDLKTVRPVHMTTVPRLLEKVHSGIMNKAEEATGLKGKLARWAFGRANRYNLTNPDQGLAHRLADKLVYSKVRDRVFGGNLQVLTSGGAALSPAVQSFINALGIICGQGYGLTETAPVISLYEEADLRPGSVGRPIRDVEVKIADDGEILARGPNIMRGYYNMPEETAAVMSKGGWFHTGDIGTLKDGHIYITDRKKQLFKLSTGKYVAPTPIEVALAENPLIEHAVVLGEDRKFCGALIVPDRQGVMQQFGGDLSPQELHNQLEAAIAAANEGRPPWEQIKKFSLVSESFTIDTGELTPTMKVRRKVVYKKYRNLIDELYSQ